MENENIYISKIKNLEKEKSQIQLAYTNLLHDVLSFNELISKKDNTFDILTLVLRLARTIIDFSSGVVFNYEASNFKEIHTINSDDHFRKHINDFISNDKYKEVLDSQKVKTFTIDDNSTRIIVPIITKLQPVGLLDIIVNCTEADLKTQDLDLLWILGSIAAIEFESVEMSNRSQLLTLMLASLEKINSEDQLDNLLYLILNNLKQIVHASSYLLILRDKLLETPDNAHYCIPEIHSLDETCSMVDKAIQTKSTIFINKLSACKECEKCTESYLHKEHDGSLMLVPLYKGDLGYGVISIYDKDTSGKVFSLYNRHIIEIFAKQATIAINNAILIDQQKRTNKKLASANDELSSKNTELDEKRKELLENQHKLQKAHDELSKKNKIIFKEIESAGVVQKAILSKIDSSENIDFHISYKPHHSVGGDYYGMINIDNDRTLIYIGDVSGKGVPAAIANGYLKNEFHYVTNLLKVSDEVSPGKILTMVNYNSFNIFQATEQFTSAWCGIINSRKKTLIYASAGHDYPVLISDDVSMITDNNGLIIGLIDNIVYKDKEIDFHYPTKIILYTDGITDQELRNGTRLSREWLLEQVSLLKDLSPEKISENIVNKVIKLSDGVDQHDDMLVITVSLKN